MLSGAPGASDRRHGLYRVIGQEVEQQLVHKLWLLLGQEARRADTVGAHALGEPHRLIPISGVLASAGAGAAVGAATARADHGDDGDHGKGDRRPQCFVMVSPSCAGCVDNGPLPDVPSRYRWLPGAFSGGLAGAGSGGKVRGPRSGVAR